MLELVTLLTGLLVGPLTLDLRVAPEVVQVEARLDGTTVATCAAPPWRLTFDLGPELAPHRLEVLGFDAAGREIARQTRGLNGARSAEDASATPLRVLVEGDSTSFGSRNPSSLDGWFAVGDRPLRVARLSRGTPKLTVVITPEARRRLEGLAEAFVKQLVTSQSMERQTEFKTAWDPEVLRNQERFVADAEPLLTLRGPRSPGLDLPQLWGLFERSVPWPADAQLKLVSPLAAPVSRLGSSTRVFNVSRRASTEDSGFLWHAAQSRPRIDFDLRLADAVAVSALDVPEGPYAVIVLLGQDGEDQSQFSIEDARRFLRRLDVPLLVAGWQSSADLNTQWSPSARSLELPTDGAAAKLAANDALDLLEDAADAWSKALEAQWIVWLEGDHPVDAIRLTDRATGVRRAVDPTALRSPAPLPQRLAEVDR